MPEKFIIKNITEKDRNQTIELVNQFFRLVNSFKLDGIFKVRPRAATKMVDVYLKLSGSGKVYFSGAFEKEELVSLIIARIEERPYLYEDKILYVDLAVTKNGFSKKGYMKSLLKDMEKFAVKKNISILELRVLKDNKPALDFWKKMGYDDFYIRFRKQVSK